MRCKDCRHPKHMHDGAAVRELLGLGAMVADRIEIEGGYCRLIGCDCAAFAEPAVCPRCGADLDYRHHEPGESHTHNWIPATRTRAAEAHGIRRYRCPVVTCGELCAVKVSVEPGRPYVRSDGLTFTTLIAASQP